MRPRAFVMIATSTLLVAIGIVNAMPVRAASPGTSDSRKLALFLPA
jgi:hypothetical protein